MKKNFVAKLRATYDRLGHLLGKASDYSQAARQLHEQLAQLDRHLRDLVREAETNRPAT